MSNLFKSALVISFFAALVVFPMAGHGNERDTTASNSSDASHSPRPSRSPRPTPNLTCVQSAVNKREGAVGSAFDAFNLSVKSALSSRRTALNSAWSLTNAKDRRVALKTAWQNWKTSWRSAAKALRDARNAAWTQYKTDLKACNANSSDEPGSGNDIKIQSD